MVKSNIDKYNYAFGIGTIAQIALLFNGSRNDNTHNSSPKNKKGRRNVEWLAKGLKETKKIRSRHIPGANL